MRKTKAAKARYNILDTFICRPLQNNDKRWPNFSLSSEREPGGLFFEFFSNISMCPRFSFVIVLTVINKVSDFGVKRDSKVKYELVFWSALVKASLSWFLKLLVAVQSTAKKCSKIYNARAPSLLCPLATKTATPRITWNKNWCDIFPTNLEISKSHFTFTFIKLIKPIRHHINWRSDCFSLSGLSGTRR